MPFSSYPVLLPVGVGHPRVSALRPLLWEERGTFCSSSRLPSRERSSLVMVPHRAASSSARSSCAPSRPMRVTTSPAWTPGQGGDIHQQLVHAHPSRHGTESAADQHTPALLGQLAGQAVGVADGDHCKPGLLAGLEGQPYPARSPGAGCARATRARRERTGFQVQAALDRGEGTVHTVQGDAGRAQAHGWGGRLRTP